MRQDESRRSKVPEGYDILGDVHGKRAALEGLLGRLGYVEHEGAYRHPSRIAIFAGDLIDRGDDVLGVLEIVRAMVNAGSARAVLGNHEYNLLCWLTRSPEDPRMWLRSRTAVHRKQQERTLPAFTDGRNGDFLEWLKDLPLWLDLGHVRVVHACWDERSMADLGGATTLRAARFGTFERRSNPVGMALETLLSGPEIRMPLGLSYPDRQGIVRTDFRARWWKREPGIRYADLTMPGPRNMPDETVPEHLVLALPGYDPGAPPLFVGHYGYREYPGLMTPNIACVDYGNGRSIGAYRWNGERTLVKSGLVLPDPATDHDSLPAPHDAAEEDAS